MPASTVSHLGVSLRALGVGLLFVLLVGLGSAAEVRAATFYAALSGAPSGSAGGSCLSPGFVGVGNGSSVDNAIQAAVDAASDGDTVRVCEGLWVLTPGTDTVTVSGKSLSIVGAGKSQTLLEKGSASDRSLLTALSSALTVRDMTLQNSGASSVPGGVLATGDGVSPVRFLTLINVELKNLSSLSAPGAVQAEAGLSVDQGLFSGNQTASGLGGAVRVAAGSSFFNSTAFTGNASSGSGGGALYVSGPLSVSKASFSGNRAELGSGGAIFTAEGSVTLSDATFNNNFAAGQGAALAASSGSAGQVTATNITVNQNRAGDASVFLSGGRLWLRSATLADNTSPGGAFYRSLSADLQVRNSIVKESGADVCAAATSVVGQGGNVVTDTVSDCGELVGPTPSSKVTAGQLKLVPLSDWGGFSLTMPLANNSVAQDAAVLSCPAFDQRGVMRSSPCDSGAFEGTVYANWGLSVTKSGSGSGSVSGSGISCGSTCSAVFMDEATATLMAVPDPGKVFTGWSGDIGSCNAALPVCAVVMDHGRSINATFESAYRLSILKLGSGRVTGTGSSVSLDCGSLCAADYVSGSSVTLVAAAEPGYRFAGFEGASCSSSPCTVSVTQSLEVTARFVPVTPEPSPQPTPEPQPAPVPATQLGLEMSSSKRKIRAGASVRLTLQVLNSGSHAALNAQVCSEIPQGFSLVSASSPYLLEQGRVCWPLGDLPAGQQGRRTVVLKLKSMRAVRGTLSLEAEVVADNAPQLERKRRLSVKPVRLRPGPVVG